MTARRGGRHRRRVLVAVAVVVVVWGALVAVQALRAYRHDKAGLAALQAVKDDTSPGQATSAATRAQLAYARSQFEAAHAELASPLVAPVTVVPVIGRQLVSVRDLSAAAATVAGVGSSFLSSVHDVLDQPHGAGPERVASLRRLADLSAAAGAQLSSVDTGPHDGLVRPLAGKYDEFVAQLDEARDRLVTASAVASVVATILQGPQHYLVLASNNAEMRAGSGAFLDVGVATTGDGQLHLGDLGPSGALTLPVGAVTVTGDLERNWGWLRPGVDWRTLGVTPRFDVTAALAARMWRADTGQTVDGVLSLDVAGLRQLLLATGPVTAGGVTVSADDVEQYLLHDQYAGLSDNATDDAGREDALGSLAGAVLRQLQGSSTDLRALATDVTAAVAGRHLLLWSADPATEAAWTRAGVAGTLGPASLAVNVINRGGNKLDQYLPVQVAVGIQPGAASTVVTLTVGITNTTPGGQSQFIAGPYPGLDVSYGDYPGILAVNLPGSARDVSVRGVGPLSAESADGPTLVVAAPVLVRRGASVTAVVRFVLPGTHGSLAVVPSARLPAEQWRTAQRTFDDSTDRVLSW